MGLRSRQRRLAGVKHEDSFDVETSKHRSSTLQEHLQASRRDVDGMNLSWKTQVGTAGLIMSLYEVGLYVQTMVVKELAPANPALCLAFKILAVASILLTRKYLLTGSSALFGASIVAIAVYIALWAACFWVFEIRFTLIQVTPVAVVYFLLGHLAAKVIGGNTKAEVARAQQLEKLERVQHK